MGLTDSGGLWLVANRLEKTLTLSRLLPSPFSPSRAELLQSASCLFLASESWTERG